MVKGIWNSAWLKQLAVAVGYALIYIAVHPISDAHWAIRSGLRLSCLILVPYRYWPALLVGELIPNAYEVYPCLDSFGPAWVAVRSIPPMALAMPIVWWCRSRLALFPAQRLIDMKTLMHCVLMVSTVWASCSYLAASLIHMKEGTFTVTPIMAAGFFIGNYIGILGIVPVVLLVNLDFRSSAIYAQFRRVVHSRLTLDIVLFALPAITLLSLVSLRGSEDARHIARMSMFLPVAWLTLKHGWRAAVVGGALAIASTCLLTQSRPDPEILQTQAFIALAITCLLGTGARISAQLLQEEKTRRNEISSQRMARRNFHVNELRRRQTSAALENLGSNLHVTNSRLIEQVRRILPHVDNQGYLKQARATQNQVYALAESMHPQAWRDRGLPAALNETIGRALDEAGMAYECVIGGRGLSRMSAPVLAAAYRSVCEAVVFVSSQPTCVSVRVRLRGGETQGKQWLTLRVEGLHAPHGEAAAARHATERQRLATKLGASALDGDQMRDLVNIFNGELHLRSSDQHERVTVLLHDAPYGAEGTDNGPEPMRLWVN